MARVLVMGAGVAGATAALEAARLGHDVTVVVKTHLGDGATGWAQGGIAAVVDPADSIGAHVADTLRAGAGLCDPAAVEVLCAEGPARIRDLVSAGLVFDSRDGVPLLGREGAHSARRILHAGGDATGAALSALLAAALRSARVEIREHTALVDLVTVAGRVTGAELLTVDGVEIVEADRVVLATGGAGQLYLHTTNPAVATGDGIAAAARAGAAIRHLEFVQFHPTALAVPGTPLVSEAVRGEGAVLLDEAGRRFMLDEHPDAELAPRDVVARGIARAMSRQGGRPVLLDARRIPYADRRFPTVTASVRAAGLDWSGDLVPVTPAAHYLMGGIATDLDGRTSLPGLLAIGECASTGVHGANRLASNSLLEGLVFGHRAAHALAAPLPAGAPTSAAPTSAAHMKEIPARTASDPHECVTGESNLLHSGGSEVQDVMWEKVGLFRDGHGLAAAVAQLDALADRTEATPAGTGDAAGADRMLASGEVATFDARVDVLETRNLLLLARLTARAALERCESIGSHARTDHPASTDRPPRADHHPVGVTPARASERVEPDPRMEPVSC